jgi:hypothetical protein
VFHGCARTISVHGNKAKAETFELGGKSRKQILRFAQDDNVEWMQEEE